MNTQQDNDEPSPQSNSNKINNNNSRNSSDKKTSSAWHADSSSRKSPSITAFINDMGKSFMDVFASLPKKLKVANARSWVVGCEDKDEDAIIAEIRNSIAARCKEEKAKKKAETNEPKQQHQDTSSNKKQEDSSQAATNSCGGEKRTSSQQQASGQLEDHQAEIDGNTNETKNNNILNSQKSDAEGNLPANKRARSTQTQESSSL